jgi:hypothetical protein
VSPKQHGQRDQPNRELRSAESFDVLRENKGRCRPSTRACGLATCRVHDRGQDRAPSWKTPSSPGMPSWNGATHSLRITQRFGSQASRATYRPTLIIA